MDAKFSVSYNGIEYDLKDNGQVEATVSDVVEDGAKLNISIHVTSEEINFVIANHPEILEMVQEAYNQVMAAVNPG